MSIARGPSSWSFSCRKNSGLTVRMRAMLSDFPCHRGVLDHDYFLGDSVSCGCRVLKKGEPQRTPLCGAQRRPKAVLILLHFGSSVWRKGMEPWRRSPIKGAASAAEPLARPGMKGLDSQAGLDTGCCWPSAVSAANPLGVSKRQCARLPGAIRPPVSDPTDSASRKIPRSNPRPLTLTRTSFRAAGNPNIREDRRHQPCAFATTPLLPTRGPLSTSSAGWRPTFASAGPKWSAPSSAIPGPLGEAAKGNLRGSSEDLKPVRASSANPWRPPTGPRRTCTSEPILDSPPWAPCRRSQ